MPGLRLRHFSTVAALLALALGAPACSGDGLATGEMDAAVAPGDGPPAPPPDAAVPRGSCVVGTACYTAATGTPGQGTCKSGQQACNPDGSFGPCVGQVVPQIENCGSDLDQDCDGNPAPACMPVAGHPRLWLTAADLPRLRGWSDPARQPPNPMWTRGMAPLLATVNATYSSNAVDNMGRNKSFFPPGLGGQPNPNWPDDGGSGVGAPYVETYAELYAFLSLVAADAQQRDDYGHRARNLLMYAINKAANCPPPPMNPPPNYVPPPYCDHVFPIYNRSNYDGEAWGVTVDWIYPYLTADDKTAIRKVFLTWADVITTSWVAPPAHTTGPALLTNKYANGQRQFRWSANNYYSGTMRNLLLMALSLDDADDPGHTLGAYVDQYRNVALYQQFAMYEDPAVVAAAYKLTQGELAASDKLGLASGGQPVEGFLYGHSLGYVFQGLLALHTAGRDDVAKYGPQAGLINSHYWDQFVDGFLHSLAPAPYQPGAPFAYLPPVYSMANYGDLLYDYITDFDYLALFSVIGVYDASVKNTDRFKKDLWIATNALPGGADRIYDHVATAWNNSLSSAAILAYMMFDPDVPLPRDAKSDPRPSLPTTFYARPIARLLGRSDWTPGASWFTHVCGWASINHENGTCGQFEFYRKGEWLTKERSGYDNGKYPAPAWGYAPDYHNVLGIQNDLAQVNYMQLRTDEKAVYERGGQWNNDANAGDPSSVASWADGYAYLRDDATNLYNRVPNKYNMQAGAATDVVLASRSTLWLKPDHIVVYDRAVTKSAGHFKRFNLVLDQAVDKMHNPIAPTVAAIQIPTSAGQTTPGNLITETTPGGQSLFVQSVLPATQTVTLSLVEPLYPVALLEPTQNGPVANFSPGESGYRLQVDDAAKPASSRFLNVLQGADAGQPSDPVRYVTSSSGTALDGVAIQQAGGNAATVVLFVRDLGPFTSATWTTPIGTRDTWLADLAPMTSYQVSVANGVVTVSADPKAAGNPVLSDSGGMLHFQ